MRFHAAPVVEGGGPDVFLALFIWTPNQRENRRSVEKFFRDNASNLTQRENSGERIIWITVVLQDVGELVGPTSFFLEHLCAFLREHSFAVAGDRTYLRPFRLAVEVSELEADGVDRSDPALAEATSRICRAFWENDRIRAAAVVNIDLPAAPSPEALGVFFRGRTHNTAFLDSPCVTLWVSDRPDEPGNHRHHDVLRLEVGGLRLVGEKSSCLAAVADAVLGSTFPDAKAGLHVWFYSPEAVAVFAASLRGRRHHGFQSISLFVGDPREMGIVDATGVAAQPPRPATLDVAGLCGALLRCPAVNSLDFQGFNFTAVAIDAAREAAADADPPAALSTLAFNGCTFSDPVHGFYSLATAMSPGYQLQLFCALGTPLQMSDVAALCSALVRSDGPLTVLALGGAFFGDCGRCLSDASVRHFFQMLPSMKRLKGLVFPFSVPGLLTRAVVDGMKNNYSLHRVTKLKFGSAQLQSEIKSYATANANGRAAVYDAVANPGDRPLLERALRALHRLSKSDNEEDATTLYLCLQLFLPFCCGDPGIARVRCWM